VPSSFQYPVERHRDLQRRWGRLLQRTAAPNEVRSPLAVPKERPDASRENDHAPRARSSSVEVRWWRTDP
jgi:hypothetical protein